MGVKTDRRRAISRAEFDPRALMARAEQVTGLSDWGGLGVLAGLEAFCAAMTEAVEVPEAARRATQARIDSLLARRLGLYADRAAYPEIAGQDIRRPLIITGLPRCGSTLLHGLVAQDPRVRSLARWEHEEPSPPPRRETYLSDPRIARSAARVANISLESQRIHRVGAQLPDECNFLTALAFHSVNLHAPFYASSYVDWYLRANDAPAFEVHLHALQHLQAYCPGQWWVLKAPPHLFHLPRIFATYPDARVVFLHRDPGVAFGSIASMFCAGKRLTYGGLDAHRAGRETLDWWSHGLERALAFRAEGGREEQILDLQYDQIAADPLGAVRAVYEWLGEDPAPAAAPQALFLADQRKDKHGRHSYSAEAYGLDPSELRERFADYIARFGIPVAGA